MRYPAILAAVAVLGASVVATAPAAAADEKTSRVEVNYNDLDLSTEEGRKELSDRYDQAARSLCGMREDGSGTRFARDCYKKNSSQIAQRVESIANRQAAGG